MTDQDLRRALRSLPRHRASEGFTRRVLDRCARSRGADHSGARRHSGFPGLGPLGRAAAAALVVAVVTATAFLAVPRADEWLRGAGAPSPPEPTATQADLPSELPTGRELPGSERARMRAELEELKRLTEGLSERWARDSEPVLYVGGDDRVELVLDIEDLAAAQARGAIPAAHRRPGPDPEADGGL